MTPESTQIDGLVGGVPSSLVNPGNFRRLDAPFTLFSTAFAADKAHKIPDLPLNIVLIGDNWVQFTEFSPPKTIIKGCTVSDRKMWHITGREVGPGLLSLAQQMHAAFKEGILDSPSAAQRLTVVDFTSPVNPLKLEELEQIEEMPWGLKGNVKEWGTQVYLFRKTD
ncbi:hypothetical protein HYT02_00245 [Candidatus Gottesmanbacteria bacterium]|nr:hypothetical protein [Candidatus Gottesmanbacteria bacterium]